MKDEVGSARRAYSVNRDLRLVLGLRYRGIVQFNIAVTQDVIDYFKEVWGIELKGAKDLKEKLRELGFEVIGDEVIFEDRDSWIVKKMKDLVAEGFKLMRGVEDIGEEIEEMKEILKGEALQAKWQDEHAGLCESIGLLEGVIGDYRERLKG